MTTAVRPYRQRPEPIDMLALQKLKNLYDKAKASRLPVRITIDGESSEDVLRYLQALDINALAFLNTASEVDTLRQKITRTAAKSTRRSKQLRQQNKTIELLNGHNKRLAQEVYDSDQKLAEAVRITEALDAEVRHLKLEVQKLRTAARQMQYVPSRFA